MASKDLYSALETLSAQDLLMLVLRDKMCFTLKEIGVRVMMSPEGVRKRLNRIYSDLEKEMRDGS